MEVLAITLRDIASRYMKRELTYAEEVSINRAARQGSLHRSLHQKRCGCNVCKGARETLKSFGIKVK